MEGPTDYNYTRVCPRDLFNESKLLKCLGQLALYVLDNNPEGLRYTDSGQPFRIGLHEAGYLTAGQGIKFYQGESKAPLWLGTTYNARGPFPLVCFVDYIEFPVFTDAGELSEEFAHFIKTGSPFEQ